VNVGGSSQRQDDEDMFDMPVVMNAELKDEIFDKIGDLQA